MEFLIQIFSFTTVKGIPATQGDTCSQEVNSCCTRYGIPVSSEKQFKWGITLQLHTELNMFCTGKHCTGRVSYMWVNMV